MRLLRIIALFICFGCCVGAVTLTNPVGSTFGSVDFANSEYTVSIGYNAVNSSGNSEHQLWYRNSNGSRGTKFKYVALSRNGTYYGAAFSGTLPAADYPHGIIFVTRWGTGLPGAPFQETEAVVGGMDAQTLTANFRVTIEGSPTVGRTFYYDIVTTDPTAGVEILSTENLRSAIWSPSQRVIAFVPAAPGSYTIQAYAKATSTHLASPTVDITGSAGAITRSFQFEVSNPMDIPLHYEVRQDGSTVKAGVLPAHFTGQISGYGLQGSEGRFELYYAVPGVKWDPATMTWYKDTGGVVGPDDFALVGLLNNTTTEIIDLGEVVMSQDNLKESLAKSSSSSWSSVNNQTSPDLLTKGAYAEGVSKLESQLSSVAGRLVASSNAIGSASASMSNAATQFGAVGDKIEALRGDTQAVGAGVDGLSGDLVRVADATEAADGKLGQIVDFLGIDEGGAPNTLGMAEAAAAGRKTFAGEGGPSVSSSASISGEGSAPSFSESVQVAGRTIVFSLSPGAMGEAVAGDDVLRDSKPLVLIAVVLGFLVIVGRDITAAVHSLSQVNAADAVVGIENALPGVGQGKTWSAAAIITGAIVAFAVALVLIVNGILGGIGVQLMGVGNVSVSAIGSAVGWLEQYLPIVPMLTLGVAAATRHYWLMPLYVGAASLLKFIKA